jgi:hypothetical protein
MPRKTLNASRLQEQVSRRLHKLQEVIDDGVKFVVPRPQLQPVDRTGCNWTMKHFGNAAGFEASIEEVLANVRAEYNLADEGEEEVGAASAEEGEAPAGPFGQTPGAGKTNPFGEAAGPAGKANPFGEAGGPAKASNPFGEAKPAGAADPFGAAEPAAPAPKRSGNPFGEA